MICAVMDNDDAVHDITILKCPTVFYGKGESRHLSKNSVAGHRLLEAVYLNRDRKTFVLLSSLLRIGVTEESIATFHGTLKSLNPKCELITVEQCFLPTPEAATAFGKLNDRLSGLSLESTHVNPAKSISIKSADQAV